MQLKQNRQYFITVTHDVGGMYNGTFYGLDVEAKFDCARDDDVRVISWECEGHSMPLFSLPDGLLQVLTEIAEEEVRAVILSTQ